MIALPQSKLKEEWFRRAIANVARDLINNRHVASDCGPLYHGMHALVVYRQRTVPGYLVPQFNSQIKLADRGKKPVAAESAKLVPPPYKPVKPVKISKSVSERAGTAAGATVGDNGEQFEKNAEATQPESTNEQPQPAASDASVSSSMERIRR